MRELERGEERIVDEVNVMLEQIRHEANLGHLRLQQPTIIGLVIKKREKIQKNSDVSNPTKTDLV